MDYLLLRERVKQYQVAHLAEAVHSAKRGVSCSRSTAGVDLPPAAFASTIVPVSPLQKRRRFD